MHLDRTVYDVEGDLWNHFPPPNSQTEGHLWNHFIQFQGFGACIKAASGRSDEVSDNFAGCPGTRTRSNDFDRLQLASQLL